MAFHAKTSGIYVRSDPTDMTVLDGEDPARRLALIQQRLQEWMAAVNF